MRCEAQGDLGPMPYKDLDTSYAGWTVSPKSAKQFILYPEAEVSISSAQCKHQHQGF